MKKPLLLIAALAFACTAAWGQPYFRLYGTDGTHQTSPTNPFPTGGSGVSQLNITSLTGSVPAASTTVVLVAPSASFDFWTSTTAANVYVNLAGTTATTSNAIVYPGSSYHYSGAPIQSFTVLGASAAGTYNVIAY